MYPPAFTASSSSVPLPCALRCSPCSCSLCSPPLHVTLFAAPCLVSCAGHRLEERVPVLRLGHAQGERRGAAGEQKLLMSTLSSPHSSDKYTQGGSHALQCCKGHVPMHNAQCSTATCGCDLGIAVACVRAQADPVQPSGICELYQFAGRQVFVAALNTPPSSPTFPAPSVSSISSLPFPAPAFPCRRVTHGWPRRATHWACAPLTSRVRTLTAVPSSPCQATGAPPR